MSLGSRPCLPEYGFQALGGESCLGGTPGCQEVQARQAGGEREGG